MLEIRKIKVSDLPRVQKLQVNEDQIEYVGTIQSVMAGAPESSHFHVVLDDNRIVGFFNIDTAYPETYSFSVPGELGLRAFFIDVEFQGRGYGKSAVKLLPPYLSKHYSSYESICLTVNCKNPSAYKCYISGGFFDIDELYHGGEAGPQNVLRLKLNP